MTLVHEPNRIPPERALTADGLGPYVTPALFKEFHSHMELDSFNGFIHELPYTVDPEGETAVSWFDYERWLDARLR
jgi:hypothetical protein